MNREEISTAVEKIALAIDASLNTELPKRTVGYVLIVVDLEHERRALASNMSYESVMHLLNDEIETLEDRLGGVPQVVGHA